MVLYVINAIPLSVLEKQLKDYDRITLYRIIRVFIEKGIIHEITLPGGASSFAICKEACTTVVYQH